MNHPQFLTTIGLIYAFGATQPLLADEAFVVLEYSSHALSTGSNSDGYVVKPGDTLARIVAQQFGHVADPQDLYGQIVALNPRAFVDGNPNKLLSGVTLNFSGAGAIMRNSRDEIFFF